MDDAGGYLAIILAIILGVPFLAFLLLVAYGAVVIVFREAFGVELPNPFDWLPQSLQPS